ncbi:MAG: hypothetical protein H0W61_17825 [Bacteroidetes bacterium]|nr:hypothetical protein [Bacteroidota bacterium]
MRPLITTLFVLLFLLVKSHDVFIAYHVNKSVTVDITPEQVDSVLKSGREFLNKGDLQNAVYCASTASATAKLAKDKGKLKNSFELFKSIALEKKDYKSARTYLLWAMEYRDSLQTEENTRKKVKSEMQYAFDQKEETEKLQQAKVNLQQLAQSRQQNIVLVAIITGLILVILFSISLFKRFRLITRQKDIIESQKTEVEAQRKIADERRVLAEKQSEIIHEKQKEILDSIRYANRIQQALMPSDKNIEKLLCALKQRDAIGP